MILRKINKKTSLLVLLIVPILLTFSKCAKNNMYLLFEEFDWIEIESTNFQDLDPSGWEDNTGAPLPVDIPPQCVSALTNMLGPFSNQAPGPNKEAIRIFDLSDFPHSEILLIFDLVIMESWDGESAIVEVDDVINYISSFNFRNAPATNYCSTDEDGRTYPDFGPQRIKIEIPHTSDQLKILVRSTLNQLDPSGAPTDEWFGIDNFSLHVR